MNPALTALDFFHGTLVTMIRDLCMQFEVERQAVFAWLSGIDVSKMETVGPFRCHGIDSDKMHALTIQIGLLSLLRMKLLEQRQNLVTAPSDDEMLRLMEARPITSIDPLWNNEQILRLRTQGKIKIVPHEVTRAVLVRPNAQ